MPGDATHPETNLYVPPHWCAASVGARVSCRVLASFLCCSCAALCCRTVPWLGSRQVTAAASVHAAAGTSFVYTPASLVAVVALALYSVSSPVAHLTVCLTGYSCDKDVRKQGKDQRSQTSHRATACCSLAAQESHLNPSQLLLLFFYSSLASLVLHPAQTCWLSYPSARPGLPRSQPTPQQGDGHTGECP